MRTGPLKEVILLSFNMGISFIMERFFSWSTMIVFKNLKQIVSIGARVCFSMFLDIMGTTSDRSTH